MFCNDKKNKFESGLFELKKENKLQNRKQKRQTTKTDHKDIQT